MAARLVVADFVASNAPVPVGHAAGDLIIVFAYRTNSATPPTLADGFTEIVSRGENVQSLTAGWKLAASDEELIGVWANATYYGAAVVRGVNSATPVGATNSKGLQTVALTLDPLALTDDDGSSLIIAFAGVHANGSYVTWLAMAPELLVLADHGGGATSAQRAIYHSEVALTEYPGGSMTLDVADGWTSVVVECRADPDAAPHVLAPNDPATVASLPGGSPEQDGLLFEDIQIESVSSVTGTLVIASVAVADLATPLPDGWSETDPGEYAFTSRTAAQAQADARSLLISGVSIGSTTATLNVDDGTLNTDEVIDVEVIAADFSVVVESGDTYDFGTVEINTEDSQQFTLVNDGVDDLEIGTVSISGTGFSIDAEDDPSDTTVVAGASTTVTVLAEFDSAGSKTGALSIASNDADSPYVINLTAEVESEPESPTSSSDYDNDKEISMFGTDDPVVPRATVQFTSSDTAQYLTQNDAHLDDNNKEATVAIIEVATASIRFAFLASPVQDAGGLGHTLAAGDRRTLRGAQVIKSARFISAVQGAAGKLTVTYAHNIF